MNVFVTGATGFYGGAIARRFALAGHRVLGGGRSAAQGLALERDGVRFIAGDLTDLAAVRDICQDQDLVVHAAALSSPWGPDEAFRRANVDATRNVLDACRAAGVRRLVHISSPSIYGHRRDLRDVREDVAIDARGLTAYARTKLEAERLVDRAVAEGLDAITLRPRALFGPRDTTVLPRLVRALEARMLPIIGDGGNVVDLTYIDNAVDAVVRAAQAPESLAGRKFNITNGEPVALWPTIRSLCDLLGVPEPSHRVPTRVAMAIALAMETAARISRSEREPMLTRYGIAVLTNNTTLDIGAATRDLGYRPAVGIDDGMRRFAAWWKEDRS